MKNYNYNLNQKIQTNTYKINISISLRFIHVQSCSVLFVCIQYATQPQCLALILYGHVDTVQDSYNCPRTVISVFRTVLIAGDSYNYPEDSL